MLVLSDEPSRSHHDKPTLELSKTFFKLLVQDPIEALHIADPQSLQFFAPHSYSTHLIVDIVIQLNQSGRDEHGATKTA